MEILCDWILIIACSVIMLNSYKRIIYIRNTSISNYIVIILYVFCVLPILLNYLIGIPEYRTIYWYRPFVAPMHNKGISVIYDSYILITILSLYFTQRKGSKIIYLQNNNSLTYIFEKSRFLSILLIFSPVIYILLSGTYRNYFMFAVASTRGLTENTRMPLMTPLMLLSVFTFFSVIFNGEINRKKIIIILLYAFAIVWISGKRFMVANIMAIFIFYIVNTIKTNETKKRLFKIIPILGIALLLFSALYLIYIRPLKETSFNSIYDMLRVDFGRDDVIKYVINQEIFNEHHILDYRGQSFLGLIASFVPREIWHTKPYPHYMYLTSSILGVSMFALPAGTTPSLLEMTICNFGIAGFFITPFLLIWLCAIADRIRDIDSKAIVLIIYIVLLTQSMDVYLIAVFFLWLMNFVTKLLRNRRIRFVIKKK